MEQDEMKPDAAATSGEAAPEPPPPPGSPAPPPPENAGPGVVGQVAAGLVLILLGAALLVLERLDSSPDHLFLILIGGVFAAGYFYRRNYGFLVPGGILVGFGSVLALGDLYEPLADAESGVLGIGLGFFLIYIVSLLYERRNRWWPLIPGSVLVLAGFPDWEWTDQVFDYWPVGVMAVGAFLLFRSVMARSRGD